MAITLDRPTSTIESPAGAPLVRTAGKRRRIRSRVARWLATVAVLTLVVLGGGGWYVASQFLAVTADYPSYPLQVLAVRGNTVTVNNESNILRPGTYSLQWDSGRVTLGTILSSAGDRVVRRFVGDARALRIGTYAHFDSFMWSSPADLHLPYRTVLIPGPLGTLPAWYVPGASGTWVLILHGRGENRLEGLRIMPTLAALHLPMLDLSYRNDITAPPSGDNLNHLGAAEWQDLEAGVRYALRHGARQIILYGFSQGGSVSEAFLHRSPLAGQVRAVVLDAPALDWNAVADYRMTKAGVPGPITWVAKRIALWRLGLSSFDEITGVHPNADFRVRTLLIQGTADSSVPFGSNASLARARPGLVTHVPFDGAEHTEAWNLDPRRYDATVRHFLRSVLK